MTPVSWRMARPDDAAALVLGGAPFPSSFAHDHPGDALIAHIHTARSVEITGKRSSILQSAS